jgi:hypothetical protein
LLLKPNQRFASDSTDDGLMHRERARRLHVPAKISGFDPDVEDEIYCGPHRYHCWLHFVGMTIETSSLQRFAEVLTEERK